jgi:cystathionine beta-lyase/cystathionine gamma-synthase
LISNLKIFKQQTNYIFYIFTAQQTIINASTLLQPSANQMASATPTTVQSQQQQHQQHHQQQQQQNTAAALANHSAALAAAYGINQLSAGQSAVNSSGQQANHSVNALLATNPHVGHPQSGQMLFPFLQNLNDEVSYEYK